MKCGHPAELALKSIESDTVLCELCEARDQQRDAESEEQRLRDRVMELECEVERRDALIRSDGYEDMRQHAALLAHERDALRARVSELEAALASPGCGEACPVAARERAAHLATRQELSVALAQRHILVEAAVRATIEAAVDLMDRRGHSGCEVNAVRFIDPAPIVRRVLGGGE